MRKSRFACLIFFFAIIFFSVAASAQKHSKKDKVVADTALIVSDSSAVAGGSSDSKKSSKKKSKSKFAEPKIVIPDTSAEDMPVPEPIGLVSDFGNVYTQGQEDTLTAMIKAFHDSTKDEIVIVAWDSLHLVPEEMDFYVHKLSDDWQIGEKDRNNGIIIAISVNLRKIRIESVTGGLTEKESWEIVHKIMLPQFANKNYYGGTLLGLMAVIRKLNSE